MAEIGDKVTVDYRATLDDGTEFDSTYSRNEPMQLTLGNNLSIPGLEKALLDMEPGETKTVHLSPEEAYGHYDESRIEIIPFNDIPNAENLPVGEYIGVTMGEVPVVMKVLKIEDGNVYLDFNHELADRDITLEITLRSIDNPNAIERELHPAGCACGCDRLKEALK